MALVKKKNRVHVNHGCMQYKVAGAQKCKTDLHDQKTYKIPRRGLKGVLTI